MGKKNKKFQRSKKNKSHPSQISEQQIRIAEINNLETAAVIEPVTNIGSELEPEENTKTDSLDETFYKTDKYNYVKKDITKIVIILLAIIIILIGTYYLSQETSVLSQFGDWVYKICHIQTE